MNKPFINIADVELRPRPAAFTPSGEARSWLQRSAAQRSAAQRKLGH